MKLYIIIAILLVVAQSKKGGSRDTKSKKEGKEETVEQQSCKDLRLIADSWSGKAVEANSSIIT